MTAITSRRSAAAVLLLSVAGGAMLRISGLERRSVSHPEMYVPGIRLPEGASEPAERTTLRRIITGTFSSDTHPPGYYLFMFPWTRVAGTSLTAMRLPSALLGAACIPLVYELGALAAGPAAGAGAAALVAFNGYHVFWSQVARMFALACFLGLASTVLLLRIARSPRRRPLLMAAYAVAILAGVATHVFFWTLLATHMIWAFANARGRAELPDICRAQLLGLVLGSPLLAFAAYQSGTTVAMLSNNTLRYAWDYVSFAFALPGNQSGYFPAAVPFTGGAAAWCARGLVFVLGAVLLARGLRRMWGGAPAAALLKAPASPRGFWIWSWTAAAIAGTLEIAFFVRMTQWLPPDQVHATLAATKRLIVMPGALAAAAMLVDRYWAKLPAPGRWGRLLNGERAFVALLGVLPFTLVAAVSQIRPLLNQRGMLFAAPYLLLLLAIGLTRNPTQTRMSVPLVAIILGASLFAYRDMRVDPADYRQFASAVTSAIGPRDLVFVHNVWYTTPILYYLPPGRYRVVGRDFEEACARNPGARVWVVLLYDRAPTGPMTRALAGYRATRTIASPPCGTAILYEPAGRAGPKALKVGLLFRNGNPGLSGKQLTG